MNIKKYITDECKSYLKLGKNCIIKMLKSPSNWVLIVLTYILWSLVAMRYSTNQNFNMVVALQNYVMSLSLVSIIIAFLNHNSKLLNLAVIGPISLLISFLTLAVSKVGIFCLGYSLSYYILTPVTILLFLIQIKQISCFAYYDHFSALKNCSNSIDNSNKLQNNK